MTAQSRNTARRRTIIGTGLAAAALAGVALVAPTAPAGAAFPGIDGRIAWAQAPFYTEDNNRIVTANPDGSLPTELTDGTYSDSDPTFSPDGTKILFRRELDTALVESIWVMDADGSDAMPVIEDLSLNRDPAWSPDGSQIAWTTNRNGSYEIFVADADGSDQELLVAGQDARWVPDGSKISYISSGAINIFTVNPDGSDPTQVTFESATTSPFDWAPDSSKVLYNCDDAQFERVLCTVNADGSDRTEIDGPGVQEFSGVFSPQGTQILFYGYPDETPDDNVLYVSNADGSDPVAIGTDPVYYNDPTWGSSPQQVPPTSTTSTTTSSSTTTSTSRTAPSSTTPRFTG